MNRKRANCHNCFFNNGPWIRPNWNICFYNLPLHNPLTAAKRQGESCVSHYTTHPQQLRNKEKAVPDEGNTKQSKKAARLGEFLTGRTRTWTMRENKNWKGLHKGTKNEATQKTDQQLKMEGISPIGPSKPIQFRGHEELWAGYKRRIRRQKRFRFPPATEDRRTVQ